MRSIESTSLFSLFSLLSHQLVMIDNWCEDIELVQYYITSVSQTGEHHRLRIIFYSLKQTVAMQQSPASSYNYPSSPASTHPLYDSGYSTFNYSSPTPSPFHFSSCPYSNDSYYTTSPTCKSIFWYLSIISLYSFSCRSIVLQSNSIHDASTTNAVHEQHTSSIE